MNNKTVVKIFTLVIVGLVVVFLGIYYFDKDKEEKEKKGFEFGVIEEESKETATTSADIENDLFEPVVGIVEKVKEILLPSYKYVTEKPTGWFKTGQEADLVLYATGFNESGGPTTLNHPGKVATDGKRLIISDTWNNRVLIWNEIPTANNQNPDLVLGQPNFNTNIARLGADGMNWPMGVATDGEKLLVADAFNSRILIWNNFPTRNAQPADLVLGASDFDTWPDYADWEREHDETKRIDWPWDVWTNGEKVIITSTVDGSILIWNSFPTENNQSADIILGKRMGDDAIGTPRSIASDGERLVVGDYNATAVFVWTDFPTRNGQAADFILQPKIPGNETPDAIMGLTLNGEQLYAASVHHIFVWNTFPTHANQKYDLMLGVQRTRDEYVVAPDKMIFFPDTFNSPYDVATNGKKLIVADYNNNRVLIFNEIPTIFNAKASVVIGRPELFASKQSWGFGGVPFSDGERLIVGVDGYGTYIYHHLPDESKAEADVVIGLNAIPGRPMSVGGQTLTAGEKLIMAFRDDKSSILIWNEIPGRDNQMPNIIIGGEKRAGRDGMSGVPNVAIGGESMFVNDAGNNRILVWNEIPTRSDTLPDFVLGQPDFSTTQSKPLPTNPENLEGLDLYGLDYPHSISSDNKHLVVADSSHRVLIWNLPIEENNQRPDIILVGDIFQRNGPLLSEAPPVKWYHPSGILIRDDVLFVVDGSNSRVLIWNELPTKSEDLPDIILGQPDFDSRYPSNSKSSFSIFPAYISFDGSFLWVGEMKWSNRILRFSVQP